MCNYLVYELEHGSVIQDLDNKTIWTTVTFTLSTIGLSLSSLALALLILTAVLFAEWRQSFKNKLLIQFMLARFLYMFLRYINDIQYIFDNLSSTYYHWPLFDLWMLIYTEMAVVTWTFIFSRQMYLGLVKVFNTESQSIWKVSIYAWIAPSVVSCLLYFLYFIHKNSNTIHYMIYMIILKWPLLIANAVLLILVLISVLKNNKNPKNNIKIVIVTMVMIFVFCFQQILVDIYRIVYILIQPLIIMGPLMVTGNILIMYQCAFSIFFWLFGNSNTIKLWKCQRKELYNKRVLSIRFSA